MATKKTTTKKKAAPKKASAAKPATKKTTRAASKGGSKTKKLSAIDAAAKVLATQHPEVARLRGRLVGRFGNFVGVGESVLHAGVK